MGLDDLLRLSGALIEVRSEVVIGIWSDSPHIPSPPFIEVGRDYENHWYCQSGGARMFDCGTGNQCRLAKNMRSLRSRHLKAIPRRLPLDSRPIRP